MNIPIKKIVSDLSVQQVSLWTESNQLHFRAPAGVISDDIRLILQERKIELIEYLSKKRTTENSPLSSASSNPMADKQPAGFTPLVQEVARHYDNKRFDFCVKRLSSCPVEQAIYSRHLLRHIRSGCVVADIGAGPGYYSELLAQSGCRVHIIDISERLLKHATERLKNAGLSNLIASTALASATNLAYLSDESVDAIWMNGPLYHLCKSEERQLVVQEAHRILKPEGVLLTVGVNRLAYFRKTFAEYPESIVGQSLDTHRQFLSDGNLQPEQAPMLGFSHMSDYQEFRALFPEHFKEVATVGVESFAAPWQTSLDDLPAEQRNTWLDIIEETGRTAEGIGSSTHFLYIGKKLNSTR